jgi:hypothetical protein
MSHLCAKLSETASTWGKLVAPWAEYVARTLWDSTSRSKTRLQLATPLTQQHRREAKAHPSFPTVEVPKPDRLCRGCGKQIRRDKSFCAVCAVVETRESFDAGRKSAHSPEYLAKRASTMRRHKHAIQNWNPADLPVWLTRELYVRQIQPGLASVPKSKIRAVLGVSEPYSWDIQTGKRIPHQRHWQSLAKLVQIGELRFSPDSVFAMSLSGISSGEGRKVDGIMGYDFFRDHVVEIDYRRRLLRLGDPTGADLHPNAFMLTFVDNLPTIDAVLTDPWWWWSVSDSKRNHHQSRGYILGWGIVITRFDVDPFSRRTVTLIVNYAVFAKLSSSPPRRA